MNDVFKLVYTDYEKVVIEVLADTPLKIAMYPYVSIDDNYITTTSSERGDCKSLTIIKKDGTSRTFDFESLSSITGIRLLQLKVLTFIKYNHPSIFNYKFKNWGGKRVF